jgi:adenylate kinase
MEKHLDPAPSTVTTSGSLQPYKLPRNLHLIVIGPPGSGKGSQCNFLSTHLGIEHIGSGDLCRRAKESDPLLGQFMEENWQVHKLASLVIELISQAIKQAVSQGKSFVLDGSPKTVNDARKILQFFGNEGIPLDAIIEFSVNEETATKRIASRLIHTASGRVYNLETCPPRVPGKDDETGEDLDRRADDKDEEAVHIRYMSWEKHGSQLAAFFKDSESGEPNYFELDANKSFEEVQYSLQTMIQYIAEQIKPTHFESIVKNVKNVEDDVSSADNQLAGKGWSLLGGKMASPIQQACVQQQIKILTNSKKPATNFPGSHPISILKENLKNLLQEDYRFARKVDGQRRLLLFMRGKCNLLDRKMSVEMFPYPSDLDPKFELTLLDGEIVQKKTNDQKENGWSFVIFDVISVGGKYVGSHTNLFDRLAEGKPVVEALQSSTDPLPFHIEFQEYLPLTQLPNVFSNDKTNYKYELDGLILIPVHFYYHLGLCRQLLKWKAEKDNTIDFRLIRYLPTGEGEGTEKQIFWQLHTLGERESVFYDWIELSQTDIDTHSLAEGDIIECYWDKTLQPKLPPRDVQQKLPAPIAFQKVEGFGDKKGSLGSGGWKFCRKRTDKDTPNAHWVVEKIEYCILDAVSEKDLVSFIEQHADQIEEISRSGGRGGRGGGRYSNNRDYSRDDWDRSRPRDKNYNNNNNRSGYDRHGGSSMRDYDRRDRDYNRNNYRDRDNNNNYNRENRNYGSRRDNYSERDGSEDHNRYSGSSRDSNSQSTSQRDHHSSGRDYNHSSSRSGSSGGGRTTTESSHRSYDRYSDRPASSSSSSSSSSSRFSSTTSSSSESSGGGNTGSWRRAANTDGHQPSTQTAWSKERRGAQGRGGTGTSSGRDNNDNKKTKNDDTRQPAASSSSTSSPASLVGKRKPQPITNKEGWSTVVKRNTRS